MKATIHFPADIPVIDLAAFAWRNGYDLYSTRDAGVEFRPRVIATNFNRVPRVTLRQKAPLWRRNRRKK